LDKNPILEIFGGVHKPLFQVTRSTYLKLNCVLYRFDHLSDIVKRVIDERPPNVIDFFEEFSRNVREQKFHVPERFPPNGVFADSRMFRPAKKILQAIKASSNQNQISIVGFNLKSKFVASMQCRRH